MRSIYSSVVNLYVRVVIADIRTNTLALSVATVTAIADTFVRSLCVLTVGRRVTHRGS